MTGEAERTHTQRSTDLPPDAPWWMRWLDANVQEAWKWGSMRWPAFCAVAAEAYAQYPGELTTYAHSVVPASWWPHVVAGAFGVAMLARVLRFKGRP